MSTRRQKERQKERQKDIAERLDRLARLTDTALGTPPPEPGAPPAKLDHKHLADCIFGLTERHNSALSRMATRYESLARQVTAGENELRRLTAAVLDLSATVLNMAKAMEPIDPPNAGPRKPAKRKTPARKPAKRKTPARKPAKRKTPARKPAKRRT